jgi:hypothetical protein
VLVDANRLPEPTPAAFLNLLHRALERQSPAAPAAAAEAPSPDPLEALEAALLRRRPQAQCFLLDLSLLLDREGKLFGPGDRALFNNLRALRDAHKYHLTYVAASRHPLPPGTELSELFYGHTLWLGPLAAGDARWSAAGYAARARQAWPPDVIDALIAASGGYPSLLRGVCEALAAGAPLEVAALAGHPAVHSRVAEFWADAPQPGELRAAGLDGLALLMAGQPAPLDTWRLTAKEKRLLEHFQAHPGQVCEKDDVIRAVWPEDRVFERGVRDDSLAQLVRRLREKIEPDPAQPQFIHTVPGRGYRFTGPR